jgi:hypothetical protein
LNKKKKKKKKKTPPHPTRRIFPDGKIHSMPSFGRGSKIICPMLVTRTTKMVKKVKTVKMVKNGQLWLKKKRLLCTDLLTLRMVTVLSA